MRLFDTIKQCVITDAFELIPGIWVHSCGYRHICTDKQIGPIGSGLPYTLLEDDAPEVIESMRFQEEAVRKNEKNRLAKAKEAEKRKRETEELEAKKQKRLLMQEEKKRQEKREKESLFILPKNNQMPKWYSDFISQFNVKTGKQSDIRETYRFNRVQWLEYLCDSSYPSTFMAGYLIVKNFLSNRFVASVYNSKQEINIADIGSGIGGASLGAITAIEEVLPNVHHISLKAYDYSKTALSLFRNCVEEYSHHSTIKVQTDFQCIRFVLDQEHVVNKEDFTFSLFNKSVLTNSEFDFVLCFKMVNELIYSHGFSLEKSYCDLLDHLSPHLSKEGCLVLLDVSKSAEKDEDGNYLDQNAYGKELNKQCREYIQKNRDKFGGIVPVPCALIDGGCTDNGYCIQQKQFSGDGGRLFPATYKVISRVDFAKSIIGSITHQQPDKYIIMSAKDGSQRCCGNDGHNRFCSYDDRKCQEGETYYDGYDLQF